MSLPQIIANFFKKKEKNINYFLALELKEGIIKAVVWKNINKKTNIVGIGVEEYKDNWQELIKSADSAISKASGDIPQELIGKTIFSLSENWLEEGRIKKEYLTHLKKLCSDLSLTPLGFVVTTEALLNFIQQKEGTPLTAILLGITKKEIAVSIIRVGKLHLNKILKREKDSISDQVAKVLKEIPEKEILPSRIILYDTKEDLELVKQDIISFPWTQKAAFLHFPKVDILPKNSDVEGIVVIGNKEINNQMQLETKGEDFQEEKSEQKSEEKVVEEKKEEEIIKQEEPQETSKEGPIIEETETLGFIEDGDVLEEVKTEIEQEKISKVNDYNEAPKKEEKLFAAKKVDIKKILSPAFSFFNNIILGKGVIIITIVILLAIGIGAVSSLWYFSKASVKIIVEPQVLEQETEIIVNPNSEKTNNEGIEIVGNYLEDEESDTQKKATTGEKTVGEKAKGEVTVYNKTTTGNKAFKSGTIIIGPSDKQFAFNEDVLVPSASSQTEGITFGKIKAKVTALEIGEDSNLSEGKKEFTIKEYPTTSYSASSEEAFKGGTSKKIKIASEKDKEQLIGKVESKLKEKAKGNFENKIDSSQRIIIETLEQISEKRKFTPEVGAEATEITLEETAKYRVLAYNDKELKNVLENIIKKSAPGNFEYQSSQIQMQVKEKVNLPPKEGNKEGSVSLKILFKVNLLPKINQEEVKKIISGKNEQVAREYINSLPNIAGFEVVMTPKLPKSLFLFPKNPNNITIQVVPNN